MLNQQPFRMPPQGPASAYETFQVKTPRGPQFERAATCEEVNCEPWRNGWITRVPASATEMVEAVMKSGRTFAETTQTGASERTFMFAPGTPCFRASQHTLPVRPDLPQLFIARDGDWRGNPRGTPVRVHQRPEDWVEHAQESTSAAIERIERG